MIAIKRNALEVYNLEQGHFFVAPAAAGAALVATEFLWDVILSKVVDEILTEVGKGIGKKIIDGIFGSTSPWEQKVTAQLQTIISQLNAVLQALRALGPLIREEILRSLQERLDAELMAGISAISQVITEIRTVGISEETATQLRLHAVELTRDVYSILDYREHGSEGRPLGLPMYAAASAGLVMVVLAQKILGTNLGAVAVEKADARFAEWEAYLTERLAPLTEAAAGEAAYLNSIPHKAPLGFANYEDLGNGEPANFKHNHPGPWWAVFAIIEGSVDQPFRFVQLEYGPKFDPTPENRALVTNLPQLPMPGSFRRPGPFRPKAYPAGYEYNLPASLDALNGRRTSLLAQLDAIRDLHRIKDGISGARAQMKRLIG